MRDESRTATGDELEAEPTGYLTFCDERIGVNAQVQCTLWENKIFRIGRDPRSNDFTILYDMQNVVSRNHCEVYAIVYEPSVSYHIYVRDRKSINGTYVNGQPIGAGPKMATGFLLDDGDVIEIRPHWKFTFKQCATITRHQLTRTQRQECKLFRDKYVLKTRSLGQGAEATVHLALNSTSGKQLVCKVVNLDDSKNKTKPEIRRRKFQEMDILRQLQHPNILAYVDAISSPHSLYTFTELASGGDLWAFIYRHEYNVHELDARIIIRQVIRGLHYLHKKGIVHRDLKPENILLAYSPKISCHRVLLSDFGASAVPQRNRMRTAVGTAGYQAPEQTGDQIQTATADMWSLGMVALALLSTITNAELQELTQMDQASLAECVDTIISKRKVPPSENGLLFVRSCLQVSPIKRLKADNAMRHVWLCTPKKHVDFFRRLDNKMMESFQVQDEIRAIPWELPDVEGVGAHQPAAVDQVPNLGCGRENAFLGINSTERIPEPNGDGRPREQTTSGLSHDDGPLVSFVGTGGTMAENSVGEDSFTKATTETVVGRGKRQERGCSLSTSGAKFLSLTDLNRHLKKPRQLNHQMHIPEELKVTKSKFLDIAPEGIATNTLSVGISQKSKSSAKRQKT